MARRAKEEAIDFMEMITSSVIMIVLGIIYFGVTLWVVKVAANFFFGPGLSANWAVLAAAILSVGGTILPSFPGRRD